MTRKKKIRVPKHIHHRGIYHRTLHFPIKLLVFVSTHAPFQCIQLNVNNFVLGKNEHNIERYRKKALPRVDKSTQQVKCSNLCEKWIILRLAVLIYAFLHVYHIIINSDYSSHAVEYSVQKVHNECYTRSVPEPFFSLLDVKISKLISLFRFRGPPVILINPSCTRDHEYHLEKKMVLQIMFEKRDTDTNF